MTTIVWAPGDLVVAGSQGVDVRLAGVEITADIPHRLGQPAGERGILVHLACVTGPATMKLHGDHELAMHAWGERRKAGGADAAGPPPAMPGETILRTVQPMVSDNRDTDYRWVASQFAGTGTEWDGRWAIVPEPPAGVKHLTIEFTVDGVLTGKSVRVQPG